MGLFKPADGPTSPPPPDVQPDWYERFFMCVFKLDGWRGCWVWTGPFDGSGYGMFSWERQSKTGGRTAAQRAHRFAFEKFLGATIPESLVVMHACDAPQCVNPMHLSLGTIDCNMADRNRKGRQARGERAWRSRLTADQVLEIRASTEIATRLATRYGVSLPVIYNIRARRIWRHI